MGVVDGLEIETGFITHDARSIAQESLRYENRRLCHLAMLRIDGGKMPPRPHRREQVNNLPAALRGAR